MPAYEFLYTTWLKADRVVYLEAESEEEARETLDRIAEEDPNFFFDVPTPDGWDVEYSDYEDQILLLPE